MRYGEVKQGIFIKREKRFIGYVDIEGTVHKVHVKQTGRCEELLIPGVTVFVEKADNPNRKTRYTLIAVIKPNGRMVNIDSQIPNKVVAEALLGPISLPDMKTPYVVTPEFTYGQSRFDFKVENNEATAYIEVKGVTLERDGVVIFPDAPTTRGLKHVNELVKAKLEGFQTYVIFIVQMEDVEYFTPNMETDPNFCLALREAKTKGVKLLAYDTKVTKDWITINKEIPIILD